MIHKKEHNLGSLTLKNNQENHKKIYQDQHLTSPSQWFEWQEKSILSKFIQSIIQNIDQISSHQKKKNYLEASIKRIKQYTRINKAVECLHSLSTSIKI